MAVLYIAEYSPLPNGWRDPPVAGVPPLTQQTVAIGGASAASNTFRSDTGLIELNTDAACSIAFGTAPVATTSHMRMSPNETRYYIVRVGDKIAVISNS